MLNYVIAYALIGFVLTVFRHWIRVKQIENHNRYIFKDYAIKFSKWYPLITVSFFVFYPLFIIKEILMCVLDLIVDIGKYGFK